MRCRVSELRIVDLLDDLCDKMQDYTLHKVQNEYTRLFKNYFTAHYHLIDRDIVYMYQVIPLVCRHLPKHFSHLINFTICSWNQAKRMGESDKLEHFSNW
jgi:hypothetical protein